MLSKYEPQLRIQTFFGSLLSLCSDMFWEEGIYDYRDPLHKCLLKNTWN